MKFIIHCAFPLDRYPLHFAVCSNDKVVVDMILSYSASSNAAEIDFELDEAQKDKIARFSRMRHLAEMLNNAAIFMCDDFGNNALHLCVIHQLPDM